MAVGEAKVAGDGPNDHIADLEAIAVIFRGNFLTVEEMAQSFVREAIMRGVYAPGEKLQQDAIAAILGVSRMPVRAGLRQLETEGLLTIHPRRGATVTTLRSSEIREIYELRILLECYLLARAIPRLSPESLAGLNALVQELEATAATERSIECRITFYQSLYELAGAPRTLTIASRLRAEVGPYLLLQRVDEHPSGHFGLFAHLEQRDVAGAQRWLRDHLGRVSAKLQELVAASSEKTVARPGRRRPDAG